MDDLGREMQSALRHVKAEWGEEQAGAGAREFARRRRVRVQVRRTAAMGLTALLLVGGGAILVSRQPAPTVARAPDRVLRFDDGSTATPTSAESLLARVDGTSFDLERGGARVVAVQSADYVIRLHRGPMIIIESRGARFGLERLDERIRVDVEDGAV